MGNSKIGQFFWAGGLDLSRDFFGIFKSFVVVPVYHGRVVGSSANKVQHVMSFNAFWKFLRLGNSACDFLGLIFGPGNFFWFYWKP